MQVPWEEKHILYGNQRYGYGVYKKNQVNIGNPFAVKPPADKTPPIPPEGEGEASEFVPVDVLEAARKEALMLVREAEMEAERLMNAAKDAGESDALELARVARETGYAEGESQAQQQYAALLAEAEETLESARREAVRVLETLEAGVLQLVLEIARKVVGMELSANPDTILGIIRTTMADLTPLDQMLVKVSADDYPHVSANLERLHASLPFLCELDIRKDASLKKGACLVETGRGTADGSAEERLRQIEGACRALLNGLPETPVETTESNAGGNLEENGREQREAGEDDVG